MKVKRLRRQMRRVFHDQLRLMWARLCALPWRERVRLAWMLARGDRDLDAAARSGK